MGVETKTKFYYNDNSTKTSSLNFHVICICMHIVEPAIFSMIIGCLLSVFGTSRFEVWWTSATLVTFDNS